MGAENEIGTFRDIAHPLNNETRRRFEEQIVARYREVMEESGEVASEQVRELDPAHAEEPPRSS